MELDLLDSQELIALAKLDIENSRTDKALIKIKKALSLDEHSPELSIIAGKIYAQLKLFDYAERHYRQYLDQNPASVHEQFELGMIMFDSNRAEQALEMWNAILDNDENHPPSLFYSSIAYLQLNSIDVAKSRLQNLVEKVPASNLYYGKAMEELTRIKELGDITSNGISNTSVTH